MDRGNKLLSNIHPIYFYMSILGFIIGLGVILFNIYMMYLMRYSFALLEASFFIGFCMGLGSIGILFGSLGVSGYLILHENGIIFHRIVGTKFVPFSKIDSIRFIFNYDSNIFVIYIEWKNKTKRYEIDEKHIDKVMELTNKNFKWKDKFEIKIFNEKDNL